MIVYKWVLRGGKMQRLSEKVKEPQQKKQKPKVSKKERRLKVNCELIEKRQSSEFSVGEKIIADFLIKNFVEFKREHYFSDLFNPYTNKFLFFDFYLPNENLVIEFDGEFHYKAINGKKSLQNQKRLDNIKNRFCRQKRIKILRIPYWRRSEIEVIICKYFDKHF